MIFYYLCDYINTAIKIWVTLQVVDGIFKAKRSKKQMLIGQAVAITFAAVLQIANEIYMNLQFSNNLLLLTVFINAMICVFLYECSFWNAIWPNLLTGISFALIDFFILTCTYLGADWFGGRRDILLSVGVWRSWYLLVYAIVILPIGRILRRWLIGKRQEILEYQNKALLLEILLLPCTVYFQRIYLQETVDALFYRWWFFILGILLIVLALCFNVVRQKAEEESRIQQTEIRMLEGNYQALLEVYDEKSILIHDMKNHLRTISGMIKEVKLEDCEAYIVQIVGEIQKGENIVWTNHKILDLVLNMKFQEARKAQIKVRCKSDDMSGLELSAAEICSLFTNLLDNAIEASLKCPEGMERRMNVVCKRHGRKLVVSVSNFMEKEMDGQEMQSLKTTKKEEKQHGFGLRSVKRTIREREGCMKVKVLGKQFQIILYLNGFSG